MRVVFTPEANQHLHDIRRRYASFSQASSDRIRDRIFTAVKRLEEFPEIGRKLEPFKMRQLRELIVPPCRVIYHIRPDRVEILGIFHGSRDLF